MTFECHIIKGRKFMKKRIIILSIIIISSIIIAIITNYADTGRVSTGHEPKYCIKVVDQDGRKVTYWGLGYKVIRYVGVSPDEPYENNIGVKMGNWLMQYELPIDSQYSDKKDREIHTLDDFYSTQLTQNHDIRNLGKAYSSFDAEKDNCFVIGAMLHNEKVYQEFMENYKNGKTAFIRVAQNTIEGDLILYDILYYEKTNQIYLVTDNTRDEFSANRNIEFMQFENMAEYEYETQLYWVLYNGEMNDEKFHAEDIFIVTTIN